MDTQKPEFEITEIFPEFDESQLAPLFEALGELESWLLTHPETLGGEENEVNQDEESTREAT